MEVKTNCDCVARPRSIVGRSDIMFCEAMSNEAAVHANVDAIYHF